MVELILTPVVEEGNLYYGNGVLQIGKLMEVLLMPVTIHMDCPLAEHKGFLISVLLNVPIFIYVPKIRNR